MLSGRPSDEKVDYLVDRISNLEPGKHLIVSHCSIDSDENRFLLYELYTDAAAFAAHKAAPHFAQWRTVAEQVLVGQVNTPGELLYTHTSEESA